MSGKSKNTVIVIYVVLAVIYAVIFLTVPFQKNATTWAAFTFGIVSILVGAIVTYITFDKGTSLKSKVYGFPMFRLGYYYTIVQLFLSIALFIAEFFVDIPVWISIVFSVILLGVLIIGAVSIDNTREIVERQDMHDSIKTETMESFRSDIDSLVRRCTDDKLRKELEKLAEEFKYSDPVLSEATTEIEKEIKEKIDKLRLDIGGNAESSANIISNIHDLLFSRNKLCKKSK